MEEILDVSRPMLSAMAVWRSRRLGAKLRARREEFGWSAADCAVLTGMTESTIVAIENGTHLLSDEGGRILVESSILLGVGFELAPKPLAA